MNLQHLILENLHINEAVINSHLVDRFIQYCKGANVKDAGVFRTKRDVYYLYAIPYKRLESLVDGFVKSCERQGEHIIFEYEKEPPTITRLETK